MINSSVSISIFYFLYNTFNLISQVLNTHRHSNFDDDLLCFNINLYSFYLRIFFDFVLNFLECDLFKDFFLTVFFFFFDENFCNECVVFIF